MLLYDTISVIDGMRNWICPMNERRHFPIDQKTMRSIDQFINQIRPSHEALLKHPVYSQVKDIASLRRFMEFHVFAVWDFMTLLKSLQKQLTCVQIPWSPLSDTLSARFVNEIVLAEETDEVQKGYYASHFELYLKAMEEVGADTAHIQDFLHVLKTGWGATPEQALTPLPIPEPIKKFVTTTVEFSYQSTHEVAAVFLFGREEVIPSMFRQVLDEMENSRGLPCPSFRLYLQRHIHLDETEHAPMGRKLLANLCEDDEEKWREAFAAASRAIDARYAFWDGVVASMSALEEGSVSP